MYSTSGHPRCRWVCLFIRTDLENFSITCSPLDHLQWMGAVRMRVQTADKNITIIPITPHHSSPSVNVFWNESCLFNTANPSRCFNFKQAFYLWKKHLIWIRRKICPDQALFKSKNSSKQISVDFDVRGQQGTDFFTGRSVIIDYGLVFCPEAKQKFTVKIP